MKVLAWFPDAGGRGGRCWPAPDSGLAECALAFAPWLLLSPLPCADPPGGWPRLLRGGPSSSEDSTRPADHHMWR